MIGNEDVLINELTNKMNYAEHMSEIGYSILDNNDNEKVIFGEDVLIVLGHKENKEQLKDRMEML